MELSHAYESVHPDAMKAAEADRPASVGHLLGRVEDSVSRLRETVDLLTQNLSPVLGQRHRPTEASALRGEDDPRSPVVQSLDVLRSRVDGMTEDLQEILYRLDL